MLKSYIKKIVKSELAKEKLNKSCGKYKSLVMYFNDTIHRQNNELSKLYNTNSSLKETIENLEGKLISKDNLLSEQKEENKHLKITLKLSKNKILELKDLYEQERNKNYKTLESEELKQEIEKLKQENEKLKIYLKKSNDCVKSLEQENEELSSKDFTINDSHIVQLEYANSKIETIGNMSEKLINKNQKLEEKLTKISNVISLYNTNDITFMSMMSTINNIKNILKES